MKKLIDWIKKHFISSKYKFVFVDEFPEIIKNKIFYIEGNLIKKDFWYVKFLCPCGCKDIIFLCLIDDISPSWKMKISGNKKISFKPSVRKKSNCKSHFWIKNSEIKWCRD